MVINDAGGKTGYYCFGDLPTEKKLQRFEIFANTGPYGAGIFKMLLQEFAKTACSLQDIVSLLTQTLWGYCLLWWNTGYMYYFLCQSVN